MNTPRVLYHLLRADFLERARRYNFLITIGLTIYVAYLYLPPSDANYLGFSLGELRGVYNSAWIGSIIAVLCSTLLILPGFYLVKDAITRDMNTRVGEILATTPISKWSYVAGKTLSNFTYLSVMVAVIAFAGMIMQLIRGEVMRISLWHYVAPLILSVLPAMLLISALAVLFETLPWLRGGFGNIVYAVLWLAVLITTISVSESTGSLQATNDPMGMTPIVFSMLEAAREKYPEVESGFAIAGVTVQDPIKTFVWNGTQWTMDVILGRALWIGIAIGMVTFAAILFNRFDPSTERWMLRKVRQERTEDDEEAVSLPTPVGSQIHLTLLNTRHGTILSMFRRTLLAELRLMFKGVRWWWYFVALGLIVASLLSPLEISRPHLLPAAWIWPILLWSSMGNRERRHHTRQLVLSAAYPLQRQLPAMWCAGFILAVIMGGGVAARLIAAGQLNTWFAWLVGATFIPSLALAFGIWSGSSKLFEVVYLVLWYVGPMSRTGFLDFMGTTDEALAAGTPFYILALSLALIGLAIAGWRRPT